MTKRGIGEGFSIWTLWSIALLVLLAAGGGFFILTRLPAPYSEAPMTIVVLLVGGFVAVTLLLYFGTIVHRAVGLETRKEALGMPEGSIRALIAMSLILMFAIIGVTVLYSGLGGDAIESTGITAAELDRLENVQIIAISVVDPAASPGAERFNVTARAELSQAGHDFGLQLLTTVSTLVVAVAGFYFGSRAVAQATKTAGAQAQQAAGARAAGAAASGGAGATGAAGTATTVEVADETLAEDEVIGAVEDANAIDAAAAAAAAEAEAEAQAADADAKAADAEAADAQAADAARAADADVKDTKDIKKPGQ